MKHFGVLLSLLMMAVVTATPVAAGLSSNNASPESAEIRNERHFQTKRSLSRLLELPKYIFEIPWYPIKHFLNFSERTDLFNRTMDVFYFNDARTFGWFPSFSSGSADVEGTGVSVFHHDLLEKKHRANFSFTYESDDQVLLKAAYDTSQSKGSPYYLKVESQFFRDSEVEIFARSDSGNLVLGSKAGEEDLKIYFLRRFEGRLTVGRRAAPNLDLLAHIRGVQARAASGLAGFSPLPSGLAGSDDEVGLVGGGVGLKWDFRDSSVRPFSGGLVRVESEVLTAPDKTDSGSRFGYTRYAIEGEYFIPIYYPHRVIVFHHTLERLDPLGGREIPFYEFPVLDFKHFLRSFQSRRFQDRGVLLFNVEYRYPIWATWDAYLFFDTGQAFDKFSNLRSSDFRYSGGTGIRFMSRDALLFVFQLGVGREGTKGYVSLQQVF